MLNFKPIAKAKASNFRSHCLTRADKLGIDRANVPMPKDFYNWLLTYEPKIEVYRKRLYLRCEYTGERVSMKEMEIDHNHPIARGGSFGLENLVITSAKNNQYKGNLTGEEFKLLLVFLDKLEPEAKKDILARLRAGSSRFKKF